MSVFAPDESDVHPSVGHAAIVGALSYNPLSGPGELAAIGAVRGSSPFDCHDPIVAVEVKRLTANKPSPQLARRPVQGR